MSRIISKGHRVEETYYDLIFRLVDHKDSAYAFDCDKDGNVIWTDENGPLAHENYRKCLAKEHKVYDPYVEVRVNRYWDPTRVECDCGEEVVCSHFTNECNKCHADYGSNGDRLAHRSFWGEETGEHIADILMIQ